MRDRCARSFTALSIVPAFCTLMTASRAEAQESDFWDAESWGHESDIAPSDEPEVAPSDDPDLGAHEDPAPRGPVFEFSDHLISVNAMLGFGTPVGLIGGTVEINPISPLALGVGAGTNTEGLQLALLARARPFAWAREKRAFAITVGVAFATGPYGPNLSDVMVTGIDHSTPEERAREVDEAYERVYWLQPEVGFELQAKSGFHLVVASGPAYPLAYSGHHCVFSQSGEPAECPRETAPQTLGSATIVLGVGF